MFSEIRTVFKYQNRRRKIFTILDPSIGNFLLLSFRRQFWQILDPLPLQNANVLMDGP